MAYGTAGCIDGAPTSPLGTTKFNASAAPVAPSQFAPRERETSPDMGGPGSTLPPLDEPGASGTGSLPPTLAGGAGGAGIGAMPTAGITGGAAGRSTAMGAGAGGSNVTGRAGTGAAGATATPNPTSGGTLTITFTSVNQSGRYAPRNVGAVWIETGSGMFVKTIERWGNIRANHLTAWNAASGGWGSFFGGGNTADKMDAISRATLSRHEMHMLTWDMKDLMGQTVPNGKYKVAIEVTEDNRVPGANVRIEFDKGEAASMVMPPDKEPYSGLVINYQP